MRARPVGELPDQDAAIAVVDLPGAGVERHRRGEHRHIGRGQCRGVADVVAPRVVFADGRGARVVEAAGNQCRLDQRHQGAAQVIDEQRADPALRR